MIYSIKKFDAMKNVIKKIESFILSNFLISGEGGVFSWKGNDSSGFLYPEITGYYLTLLCYLYSINAHDIKKIAHPHANFIIHGLQSGAVCKDQTQYVFDTAVCLSALLSYESLFPGSVNQIFMKKMADFIQNSLNNKCGCFGHSDNRWSTEYNCHLIKCSIALHKASTYFTDTNYLDTALKHTAFFCENAPQDVFSVFPEEHIYLHAACYAYEGLLYLTRTHIADYSDIIASGLEKIASFQNPDGSFPAFISNNNTLSTCRNNDSIIQTIRLMSFYKDRYNQHIEKALQYIMPFISDDGGVYYSPKKKHINAWTTFFFLQTLYFLEQDPAHNLIV